MSVVEFEMDGHVAVITMNRPEKRNALNYEMLLGLAEAWQRYAQDDEAWVAILTGRGPAFCAGMDLKERSDGGERGLALTETPIPDLFYTGALQKPTIAAINGLAFGGGLNMLIRADLRVAVPDAPLQVSEIQRGVIAGYDYFYALENLPYAVAAELAAGETISAKRAYEVGLINRLAEPESLMATTLELAHRLTKRPPLAVEYNLRLLRAMRNRPGEVSLLVQKYIPQLQMSEDAKESAQAFLERRDPVFRRR